MLAVLIHCHRLAVGVVDVFKLFEVSVGMAAEDDVDVGDGRDELVVVHVGSELPSQMGKTDYEVAFLLLLQHLSRGASRLYRVEISHTLVVLTHYEAVDLRAETYHSYLHAVTTHYGVRLDKSLGGSAREVAVGADYGERGETGETGEIVETEVKLMVA